MKINNTNFKITDKSIKQRPHFGSAAGVVAQGLRYLNVNEAIGATLVDFSFMAMPRTIVDSRRGWDAGVETGIRENSGTANHVLIGTVGGLAGLALSGRFNKNYNVYSHSIFANNETIDILGQIWHKNFQNLKHDKKELQKTFYQQTFENLQGLKSNEWVHIDKETIPKLTETFMELSKEQKLKGKRIPKQKLNYLKNLIISSTGAEKEFKLIDANGKAVSFPITSFLDDLFALGKAFSTHKVTKAFEESIGDFKANTFIKELKKLKINSAILALGISSAMGASVQPFNRWLTKKRTGKDGFVGVSNDPNAATNKPDKSKNFILTKTLAAAGMIALALASISTNLKDLPNKIQFKGKIPTLNQFKLVYGFTIASRFLASRSSDELRESCFKDILGFTNWLILGGFVTKGVVNALDKTLINSKSTPDKKGFINWLTNKSVKTVDEVLLNALKEKGINTITNDGKAIPFKKLLKTAKELNLAETLKKVRVLNIAQVAGYVYSGLVLGILIPKMNIQMTKHFNAKKANSTQNTLKTETTPDKEIKKENIIANENKGPFANFIKQQITA